MITESAVNDVAGPSPVLGPTSKIGLPASGLPALQALLLDVATHASPLVLPPSAPKRRNGPRFNLATNGLTVMSHLWPVPPRRVDYVSTVHVNGRKICLGHRLNIRRYVLHALPLVTARPHPLNYRLRGQLRKP